jgi:branched-chain amino acid transport system substrate-binding protein
MLEVTSGGTKCNTFQGCKDLLADGEDIDYDGASGALDLNENGHVTSGAYDIWQYDAAGAEVTLDEPQIVIEL